MKLFLSIFILTIIVTPQYSNSKKKTQFMYSSNLWGIKIYSKISSRYRDKDIIGKVPYGEKLNIIEVKEHKDTGDGTWYKIRHGTIKGWVYQENVSTIKPENYYLVVTRNGLNLRKGPSIKEQKILVIPYLGKGKIHKVATQSEKIQGRSGFWFQAKYKNKIGWLFSGFVIVGDEGIGLGEQGLYLHTKTLQEVEKSRFLKSL